MDAIKKEKYKVLILEDAPTDAELMERELKKSGLVFVSKIVMTKNDFSDALDTFQPDIILADYKLPGFDGLSALKIAKEKRHDCPVILVTGAMKEEEAVVVMESGVSDYILKDNLMRLAPAVKRTLLLEDAKTDKLQYTEGIEKMNKFMVDRELKMIELKKEVEELKKKTG